LICSSLSVQRSSQARISTRWGKRWAAPADQDRPRANCLAAERIGFSRSRFVSICSDMGTLGDALAIAEADVHSWSE
jgi:hypothetical protein